jgi:hypothetical protein
MEFYREVYKDSKRWDGEPLEDKSIIVYCEQGFGDIIQFARYFSKIETRGNLYLHCPKELHRIFKKSFPNAKILEKTDPDLPEHDFHVLSMTLPLYFGNVTGKYLYEEEIEDLSEFDGLNIGLAWESKAYPEKSLNLGFFRKIKERANTNVNLFMLQDKIHNPDLIDQSMDLYSTNIEDFADTARLIAGLDVVISIDTAVLHLAGAMDKKTYGLIDTGLSDGRFNVCKKHELTYEPVWYPSMRILFKEPSLNWADVLRKLLVEIQNI